jgi:hypothetical protein
MELTNALPRQRHALQRTFSTLSFCSPFLEMLQLLEWVIGKYAQPNHWVCKRDMSI